MTETISKSSALRMFIDNNPRKIELLKFLLPKAFKIFRILTNGRKIGFCFKLGKITKVQMQSKGL